ncbi:MAG: cobalamin-dependent protein, partial [Candidatus Krumholzibacteria bacterium]|nr:cobalamin-dependent protein [Candidatus Krumholzibacteria bacterium]
AAVQEDVDVVSVSVLSGAHMTLIPKIRRLMDESGMKKVHLIGGGIIPEKDAEELKSGGKVSGIFGPGTDTRDIVTFIQGLFKGKD